MTIHTVKDGVVWRKFPGDQSHPSLVPENPQLAIAQALRTVEKKRERIPADISLRARLECLDAPCEACEGSRTHRKGEPSMVVSQVQHRESWLPAAAAEVAAYAPPYWLFRTPPPKQDTVCGGRRCNRASRRRCGGLVEFAIAY